MDKLKTMLHSKDKEEPDVSENARSTGRVTGPGTHFPREDQSYSHTTGPVADTTSGYLPGTDARQTTAANPTSSAPDDGIGTVAIGKTSTYSSHALTHGDAVGSIVDTSSKDPTTYQRPETTYGSHAGVPSGAAETAASLAFKERDPSTSHIPGAYPKDESSTGDSARPASTAIAGTTGLGSAHRGTPASAGTTGFDSTQGGSPATTRATEFESGQRDSPAMVGAATAGAAAFGATQFDSSQRDSPSTTRATGFDSRQRDSPAMVGATGFDSIQRDSPATAPATGFESAQRDSPATARATEFDSGQRDSPAMVGAATAGAATSGATHFDSAKRDSPSTTRATGFDSAQADPAVTTGQNTKYPSSYDTTTVAPSTLTSTSSPGDRSADYGSAEKTKVPDASVSAQTSTATRDTTRASEDDAAVDEPKRSGTLGKILGAVGLGVAAGGAIAAATKAGQKTPGSENTSKEPSTTTGVDAYASPTHSGDPVSHHRKESIPTTAYPAGQESPSPIHAPVGGTSATAGEPDRKNHSGRNTAIASAGAGAGAASLGAHEYEKSRSSGQDVSSRSDVPPTSTQSAYSEEPSRKDQAGRNTAIASAGAGAGAASLGAHEYEKSRSSGQDVPSRSYDSPTSTQGASSYAPYAPTQESSGARRDIGEKSAATTSVGHPATRTEPEGDSRGYGKTAAAAGLGAGAGAGAAGLYAQEHKHKPEYGDAQPGQSSTTQRNTAQPQVSGTELPVREKTAAPVTSARDTQTTSADARTHHTADSAKDESHGGRDAGLAGAAGAGAGAYGMHEHNKHEAEQEAARAEERRQKDLAEQEAARQKQYEKDQKAADKLAAKEEKAAVKEEKKHQKEIEKEEKAREKAAAKEEKHHQTEVEKEQTEREHAAMGAEAEHHKQSGREERDRFGAEEAEKTRREKELAGAAAVGTGAAAGTAYARHEQRDEARPEPYAHEKGEHTAVGAGATTGAVAGTAYAAHERRGEAQPDPYGHAGGDHAPVGAGTAYAAHEARHEAQPDAYAHEKAVGPGTTTDALQETDRNRLHKDPPEEKKPSLFKRIFKRRKNTETGEDEDYSTDEEDSTHHDHHHGAEAGAVGGAGAGLAGAEAGHTSDRAAQSNYEAQSGGFQKPSYNPFSSHDPAARQSPHPDSLAHEGGMTGGHEGAHETGLSSGLQGTTDPTEPATGAAAAGGYRKADTNLGPGVGTHMDDGGVGETPTGVRY